MQVTSPEVARAFSDEGMSYGNTFGGCTAAGAAGSAVLRIIKEENLQEHAHRMGQYIISKLEAIKQVRKSHCEGTSACGDHR